MAEEVEKTPEQIAEEKKQARAKKVKQIANAIKSAFKLELKDTKQILGGIQGKLTPAELNALTLTDEQKKLCIDCGIQRSAATREYTGAVLPYSPYRNFRKFDKDNRRDGEFPEVKPNDEVIATATRVKLAMDKFYKDNEKDLNFLENSASAKLKTYFRFVEEEEEEAAEESTL